MSSESKTETSPIFVSDPTAEINRRLHFVQLLSWSGIKLPLFVTSAMYDNGMYIAFTKILEDQKRKEDAVIASIAAESKKHNAQLEEDNDDDDDESEEDDNEEAEDSDEENKTENNEQVVVEKIVKKEKVKHTDETQLEPGQIRTHRDHSVI